MDTQKTEISEERKKAALAKFMSIPVTSADDVILNYTNSLNEYCERFNAKSHDELMSRADELEFEPQVCSDILDKYSFIQRNKFQ
ncbi:MAG: hypothetical protein ACLGHN_00090 [Bacteriovoracia bacterium]